MLWRSHCLFHTVWKEQSLKFHRFEIYHYNDLEKFMQLHEQQYLAFAGRNTVRLGEGPERHFT